MFASFVPYSSAFFSQLMLLLRIVQLGGATVFGFPQLFKSIKHEFWSFPDALNALSSGSYQRLLSIWTMAVLLKVVCFSFTHAVVQILTLLVSGHQCAVWK